MTVCHGNAYEFTYWCQVAIELGTSIESDEISNIRTHFFNTINVDQLCNQLNTYMI